MKIRILALLCPLALLLSCGTTRINSRIGKTQTDVLRGESLSRYSLPELTRLAESEDLIIRGSALCQLKKFKAGEKVLLQQNAQERQNPLYWNALAVCALTGGALEKSEFYLSLAAGIKTNDKEIEAIIKTNQGLLFLKLRHFMAAKNSFEAAIKLSPERTNAKFNLAHLSLQFALFDEAHTLFTELIALSPRDPDIIAGLATYYSVTNEVKKALHYFEQLPEDQRLREDISNAYALALYQDGQYEKCYLTLEHARSTVLGPLRQTKSELLTLVGARLKAQRELGAENSRKISSDP